MNEINFEEIKKIVDSFPQLPKRERSMIEIGGCRNDENVNSDYLAFFLREDEEHNLGRLLFDALLEVLEFKIDDYQGSYEVEREFSTSKKNRIDIVIQSKDKDWAIIIENKIYHYLKNDLQDYWDFIKIENKKGVILSLIKEHQEYHKDFKNITHKELIDEIKEKLGQNITSVNPKFLPFLQDFILNVENYYYYMNNSLEFNKTLKIYSENYLLFKKIEEAKSETIKYIEEIINNSMSEIGFISKNNSGSEHRYYYFDEKNKENKEILIKFRFYINIEKLLSNHFLFTFEYKSKAFKEEYDIKVKKIPTSENSVNRDFYQLQCYNQLNFLQNEDDFQKKFEKALQKIKKEIFPIIGIESTTQQ